MAASLVPIPSPPIVPASTDRRCPRHAGPLVEGFVGRLVEDVHGTITASHRRAWFCIAPGCTVRRLEKETPP